MTSIAVYVWGGTDDNRRCNVHKRERERDNEKCYNVRTRERDNDKHCNVSTRENDDDKHCNAHTRENDVNGHVNIPYLEGFWLDAIITYEEFLNSISND